MSKPDIARLGNQPLDGVLRDVEAAQVRYRDVYLIQVFTPNGKWTRVGKAYLNKETAKSWVPFVKGSYHGMRTRTKTVRIPRNENGRPTPKAIERFSTEFNMDLS